MVITKYSPNSGAYIVAESIDCGGKGSIINAIKQQYISENKLIMDMRTLWPSEETNDVDNVSNPLIEIYGVNNIIPKYTDLKKYYKKTMNKTIDSIFLCEPTFANVGLAIRNKITHEIKGKNYNASDTAQAYADDREELIINLIKPAIEDGVDIFCERNFCSSVVYQSSMDNPVSPEDIMSLSGNKFAIQNAPHLYIICDVSAETAMERKDARVEKQDHCKFEVPEFQKRIEDKYRSDWLKDLLVSHGSKVVYVNTEKPSLPEDTRGAAIKIFKKFKNNNLITGEKFNFDL